MNRLTRLTLGVHLLCLPLTARSAPTLTHIHPAGGRQGSSFTLQAGGETKPWPLQAWTDCPGVRFTPTTNEGTFEVTISTNSPAGPHLLRLHSDESATDVRTFVVGSNPELAEVEPNDDHGGAQAIAEFPVTLNGRLAKRGDIDCFAVELRQGQTLVASIDSYSIGSPIDPHLHLLNPDRVRVAFAHDSHNLDPRLHHTATEPGTHLLQLAGFVHPPAAEVRFHGADTIVYRLHLTTGPHAAWTYPAGARRNTDATFEVHGFNFEAGVASIPVEIKATQTGGSHLRLASPSFPNTLDLPVDDTPGISEEEIAAAGSEAVPLSLPIVVNGRIDPAGDSDTFQFEAAKGTDCNFRLQSVELGFEVDGYLRVLDGSGKELARADDTDGERDPTLNWKAPADGTYSIVVADLYERGAPGMVYRLHLEPATPGFTATVPPAPLTLEPGKSIELKVTVKRTHGHKAPLRIDFDSLPEGVRFESEPISEKDGEVKITLTAAEEIPPASAPIRVRVDETEGDSPRSTFATYSLRPSDYRGPILINETAWLWLTVKKQP